MSATRRVTSRLDLFVEGFSARLLELGYTSGTVRNMLKEVGRLGGWMEQRDLQASQLSKDAIDGFICARRSSGCRRAPTVRAFAPLLQYLDSLDVLAPTVAPSTPVDDLVGRYKDWLVVERGLAVPTVHRYEVLARRFLDERAHAATGRFVEDLAGSDVVGFLVRECARLNVGAAKGRVAELRSLLRFLYLTGSTTLPLATAVPPVAGWRDTRVPLGIAARDVQLLLDSCDLSSPDGIRDFAILTLVARLGLRSAEVARLELGDIDWRAGEIAVRGKARRQDRMPLLSDVGEALACYLSDGRPTVPIRQVFLALKAPTRAIRPDLVSDVTRRACDRAGVPRVGAHRLRHALATELLWRGSTLAEVSQILRHRDLATTAVYAKVDLVSLRSVAPPWPGAAS